MEKTSQKLISVVIPVYNAESYITKCLDSILSQSYQEIEVIAVDDGSNDRSGSILDEYAKKHTKVNVLHKENGGVTKARLIGVSHANGEYIGFVDGDDTIEPNMFEKLIGNMVKYNAEISHCGYKTISSKGTEYYHNTGCLAVQDNLTAMKELLSGSRIEPAVCNKLFHKSLFHSLLHDKKMDLSIKHLEDLLMNYYLFREANCSVYEDFCPYNYMIRLGSATKSRLKKEILFGPFDVQKILLQETQGQQELQEIIYGRMAALCASGVEMELGDQPDLIAPYREECKKELRRILPLILKGKYDRATKLHALLAAVSPSLSRAVHVSYAKKKGTYGKYDFLETSDVK